MAQGASSDLNDRLRAEVQPPLHQFYLNLKHAAEDERVGSNGGLTRANTVSDLTGG